MRSSSGSSIRLHVHGVSGRPATQTLPWLANTFFAKNEALLPRISWNAAANGGAGGWEDDPYNVPEMPREYPEPSSSASCRRTACMRGT